MNRKSKILRQATKMPEWHQNLQPEGCIPMHRACPREAHLNHEETRASYSSGWKISSGTVFDPKKDFDWWKMSIGSP